MANSLLVEEIIHGSKDDMLYVSPMRRRCGQCQQVKMIQEFRYSERYNKSSIECRVCLKGTVVLAKQEREMSASDALANAINTATKRKSFLDATPKTSELVKAIYDRFGGVPGIANKLHTSLQAAMESENPEVARKSSATLLDLLLRSEKQSVEPIDFSDFTEEDQMMILRDPARELILSSPEFRRQLMNDSDIRRELLATAGIEVLESETV